jgi:cyclopropane fatty-acyl-phospholipid synthase-like methyltransferase
MSIGSTVRRAFGPIEPQVSSLYRSLFIDLDACAAQIAAVAPAQSILEIGCGEGQLAEALLAQYPEADYVGIDPMDGVGRLFRGDRARARFETIDLGTFAQSHGDGFDLVLTVDVLHHVQPEDRPPLLSLVRQVTRPGGHYAVKDWVKSRHPLHAMAYLSDRVLTGDRVAYFASGELEQLTMVDPADALVLRAAVKPRGNNLLLVYRRSPNTDPA